MNIDEVYHRIGGFGTFQKKAFALYLIGSVYYGTQIVINIFAGVLPTNQTCAGPQGIDACDANCTKLQFNDYDGYHSYSIEVSVIKCCWFVRIYLYGGITLYDQTNNLTLSLTAHMKLRAAC